jgi:hypothetical protein
MNRNKSHHSPPSSKKRGQSSDKNDVAHFAFLAEKIGFDEREIAEMEKLYQSQLEKAKDEHRSSI